MTRSETSSTSSEPRADRADRQGALRAVFDRSAHDRRAVLVAYLTFGDPDPATSIEVLAACAEAGAGVIELGVPFSDPVADGPVIQRASQRALDSHTTLEQVLQLARDVRKQSDVGMIVFSYLNPVLRFGLARFCAAAQDAGVDGALLIDLPVEEAGEYLRCTRTRDLATVFLAAPTSTDERLKRIAEESRGFVYAVSRTGVTGTREEVATDASALVKRIRKFTDLPIGVGFGVSNAEQFAEVGRFADIVVVGSAIVQVIEENAKTGRAAEAVAEFISKLRGGVAVTSGR
jgi:tryptophan synthase alpha chain